MERVIDYGERMFVIVLALPFIASLFYAFKAHPNVILIGALELTTVVLILVRRPGAIAIAPYAVAVAFAATALPLLVRADGAQLIGSAFGSAIMTAGLLLSFYAKLSLNRSFGLVAANRGLKSRGAYRIVRHPMYLGYAVTHLGFLLTQFSRWNLLVYVAAWTFQILRMHEEERFLYQDDDYRTYTKKVVSRLIPGVY